MEWRTFNQRLILLALLGGLVIGLIAAGLEPYVALAVAGGILWLLRDAWTPDGGDKPSGKAVGKAAPRPALAPRAQDASSQGEVATDVEHTPAPDATPVEGEGL